MTLMTYGRDLRFERPREERDGQQLLAQYTVKLDTNIELVTVDLSDDGTVHEVSSERRYSSLHGDVIGAMWLDLLQVPATAPTAEQVRTLARLRLAQDSPMTHGFSRRLMAWHSVSVRAAETLAGVPVGSTVLA